MRFEHEHLSFDTHVYIIIIIYRYNVLCDLKTFWTEMYVCPMVGIHKD
jgi:hypothetical protein